MSEEFVLCPWCWQETNTPTGPESIGDNHACPHCGGTFSVKAEGSNPDEYIVTVGRPPNGVGQRDG